MKRFKFVFALALIALIFSASVISVSALERSPKSNSLASGTIATGLYLDHHDKHHGHVYIVLKENLKCTDAEILEAKKSGKTAFDLAKAKGVSEEKLKSMIYEEKCKDLDNNVKDGKLAKESAEKIKIRYKEKLEKWDGKLKDNNEKHENQRDKHDNNEKSNENNE